MIGNPLTPKEITVYRDRIITEIARVRGEDKDFTVPQSDVEELFNRSAFISNKANLLAQSIAKAADEFFIPVHPDALAVVAAVRRKSADSPDGLRISFDLFRDCVDYAQKVKRDVENVVLQNVQYTPNETVDLTIQKIKARASLIQSGEDDLDETEILSLVTQFAILAILHELLKPFEGAIHVEIKDSGIVSVNEQSTQAVLHLHIILGIIMQMIIIGWNEAELEKMLDNAALFKLPAGMTGRTLIEQAKATPLTEKQKFAQRKVGLNDYSVILKYAFDFLARNQTPGYDMWISYVSVVQMRNLAQSMWVYAPFYSVPHAIAAQEFTPRKGRRAHSQEDESRSDIIQDDVEDMFKWIAERSIVPIGTDSYLSRKNALDGMDNALDIIGQVLSADFTQEVICCLGAFVKELPDDTLKILLGMLRGVRNIAVMDPLNVVEAIHDLLATPDYIEVLALAGILSIEEVFDEITEEIIGLFDEDMDALICCPLIGPLIDAAITFIVTLETRLKDLIKQLAFFTRASLGLGYEHILRRHEVYYESRILTKMINIIELALRAVDMFEVCALPDDDPRFESLRSTSKLPTIKLEPEQVRIYFSNANGIELQTGKYLPAIGEGITRLAVDPIQAFGDALKEKKCFGCKSPPDMITKAADNFKG